MMTSGCAGPDPAASSAAAAGIAADASRRCRACVASDAIARQALRRAVRCPPCGSRVRNAAWADATRRGETGKRSLGIRVLRGVGVAVPSCGADMTPVLPACERSGRCAAEPMTLRETGRVGYPLLGFDQDGVAVRLAIASR